MSTCYINKNYIYKTAETRNYVIKVWIHVLNDRNIHGMLLKTKYCNHRCWLRDRLPIW